MSILVGVLCIGLESWVILNGDPLGWIEVLAGVVIGIWLVLLFDDLTERR